MLRDEAYLLDMQIFSRRAQRYVSGVTWEQFEQDEVTQTAIAYVIQVIGEAANRVSAEFRSAHPEIPWHEIVGMRHRLVHGYRDIDIIKVWDAVQNDIPALLELLEPLVPPEEQ